MPVMVSPPVERVILRDVSWDLYERLLAEVGDSPGPRLTYDSGLLQIMVPSLGHDNPNRTLDFLVQLVAAETKTDQCPAGSTTFKRPDLRKGFEPDSSFYFRHAAAMNGKSEVDLAVDPPPELVIEVDNTRNSLDRFPLFAAIGVPEVWRYKDGFVTMFALRDKAYAPIENSLALPLLSARAVTRFVEEGLTTQRVVWFENVKEWVRQAQSDSRPFQSSEIEKK